MAADRRWRRVVGVATVLLLAACASPPHQTARQIPLVIESRARLILALDACSATSGFSPAAPTDVAENALAPGEREWRECAYAALRVHALANAEVKGQYEHLIAEDKAMTVALEAGRLTRRERRARLDELIAEIRVIEDRRARSDLDIRQSQNQQLQQTYEGLKEITR